MNDEKKDLTCPWHEKTEADACNAIKRTEKLPTFKQLIGTIISALVLLGAVSGAVYATSQARLKSCEDRIASTEKTGAIIAETLKRIEEKLDTTIRYQERRENKVDHRLDDMDRRLREIERGPYRK